MPLIRKTVESMHGYVPGEQPEDNRVIKLNTNENPYPSSPSVCRLFKDWQVICIYRIFKSTGVYIKTFGAYRFTQ